jgi:two-component system, NtrC family, response regulator AtoC
MPHTSAVLVVGCDIRAIDYIISTLGPGRVETARDGLSLMTRLKTAARDIGAVLLDMAMPNGDAIETLCDVRRLYPDLPVIMMSAAPSPMMIVAAMKNGATDFLCDSVTREDLEEAITRTLNGRAVPPPPPLREPLPVTQSFFGNSPGMAAIGSLLGQIGWSDAPVLIQGETGSGKEVIAREVHANSRRAKKPFFKLNCAALPSELVESELFGYERGAFTGAFQRKPGIFEAADGGTILLDEIGDMDVQLQAKLLQVLQDHEFQRIGGKETIKVDVRVIAATHRDLEKHIQEGKFREDLYYRLNVVNVVVPPLRERKEDIPALMEFLLKKHLKAGNPMPPVTFELRSAMLAWSWPGNVRELENFVRKLLIFQDPATLTRELQGRINRQQQLSAPAPSPAAVIPISGTAVEPVVVDAVPVLEQVNKANRRAEAEAILSALNTTHWNRKQAAVLLNIDYKALLYKMKKLGIDQQPRIAAASAPSDSAGAEPIKTRTASAAAAASSCDPFCAVARAAR